MPTKKIVHIKPTASKTPLSPAQRKFNKLIQQIDTQKKLLAEWQDTFNRLRQQTAETLIPLEKTLRDLQADMAKLFDAQFSRYKFTAKQQNKLSYLICFLCDEAAANKDDDELEALYDKHSGDIYDFEIKEDMVMMEDGFNDMSEQQFSFSFSDGEFDLNNPEAAAESLFNKINEHEAERPQPKKTAKQLAKEAKEAEEAANISKSIQAVYRQLSSALHPDREQDEVERARKTELMQQVNIAYKNRDLLKLLELQLSVEQIDESKLANISLDRLKHYNKILTEQLREIQEEVFYTEDEIRQLVGADPYQQLTPKTLGALFKQDIRDVENQIATLEEDLVAFRNLKILKSWLNSYQIPMPSFYSFRDDMPPF